MIDLFVYLHFHAHTRTHTHTQARGHSHAHTHHPTYPISQPSTHPPSRAPAHIFTPSLICLSTNSHTYPYIHTSKNSLKHPSTLLAATCLFLECGMSGRAVTTLHRTFPQAKLARRVNAHVRIGDRTSGGVTALFLSSFLKQLQFI